ncbi:hypothetical protein MNAN1_002865 [Malassezia nana]|uniref:START domain-containing protein n=1 Tax=Malassezia nana TaxID=180528 RepID=A0AAF0ELB2_9BASI|nr:hypothetical protein MNAN1_002865 [Malassezia nana]
MEDATGSSVTDHDREWLHESWKHTLEDSMALLTALHVHEQQSPPWQMVLPGRDGAPDELPESVSLAVQRQRVHGSDVYRATRTGTWDAPDLGAFLALLTSQELVPKWLPIVERSEMLETLGLHTRLCKMRFKFGRPSSPRDAVVLAQVRHNASTLVLVASSVPRTPDAPSYLRPTPPDVRAHVHLLALVVQRHADDAKRLYMTAYWALDPRGSVLGVRPSAMIAPLPRMLPALIECVKAQGTRIAYVAQHGDGLDITSQRAEPALHLEYTVLENPMRARILDESAPLPTRTLRVRLAAAHGWDVCVSRQARVGNDSFADVQLSVVRSGTWYELDVQHGALDDADAMVSMVLEASSTDVDGVRVNGAPVAPASRPAASAPSDALLARFAHAEASAPPGKEQSRRVTSISSLSVPAIGALAATVRRHYVYFASLLQEPEAKWTHVSDTRGVTVTKLDSIDPTLVVYRAEATFVGLSVWDLYSLLSTPALVARWSAGVERGELVEDLGGQSSVWHVGYPGSWPVSQRDAALVQTAYRSPTSIHLFSFSAEDQAPPAEPGTIRMHVDLQGWSIEALSPTTVHVTLIEQSDPRGWLPKTRIPPLMVAAMAGAGERALKHGAPPIVSRMLNARAVSQSYPPEMDAFHLSYVACADAVDDEADTLECELRCDVERWAPNLDIRVTPPPTAVSCLRRHALTGSGGLWLTLEHAGAERVQVVVRKGPAQSVEHGVVLLNGLRVSVDTDELDAAQVQALTQKKRTKPQRVPLDGLQTRASSEALRTEEVVPSTATPNEPTPPTPRMQAALPALALLQRLHAEQPPDPAGEPAGWTLVSEKKGQFVRRRMIKNVSPHLAVHRADKIVQGIAAEDLLPLVAYPGARAHWDEQLADCRVLESYGSGASVQLWTTPPSLLFQGRSFVVASLTARLGAGADDEATKSPVFFHASASCDDAPLPPALAEAAGTLPRGRVWIDGWILENVDPYSTESYAIPSTRCTHVVALDYGGFATGLQTLWYAALPRVIMALERGAATLGPCPSVRVPVTWLSVRRDDRDDDDEALVWALRQGPHTVVLLASDFDPRTRTLSVLSRVVARSTPGWTSAEGAHSSGAPGSPSSRGNAATESGVMRRATSSPRLRPRTSATFRQEPPAAWCVAEVQVELRHYSHGYSVDVRWTDVSEEGDLVASPSRRPSEALPLEVHVLDRPPSALQAATHASTETHCHCVRVTLPVSAMERRSTAALVRVAIAPLQADGATGAAGGHVPVTCNGRIAEIAYGADAARGPWRAEADTLERVRPEAARPLPSVEVGTSVLAHPFASVVSPEAQAPPPPAARPPSEATSPEVAPSTPPSPPSPATSPLFGLLRSSRGYGVFASFMSGSGRSTRRPSASVASETGTSASARAHETRASTEAPESEKSGGEPPGALASTDVHGRQGVARARFTLSTLILAMLVSFLAGSLVRAFMQPADFVLMPPTANAQANTRIHSETAVDVHNRMPSDGTLADAWRMLDMAAREVDRVVRAARQLHVFTRSDADASWDEGSGSTEYDAVVRWRELRRYVDVGLPGLRWRLLVGVARA